MSKRLEKIKTPFADFRRKVLKYISIPFNKISDSQKFWIGFALLCLITTLFINNPFIGAAAYDYKSGDIADQMISSPADITVVDKDETERIKQFARDSIPPIFSYESNLPEIAVQNFSSAWEDFQKKIEKKNSDSKADDESKQDAKWTGTGGEKVGAILADRRLSKSEFDAVTRVLTTNSKGYIYDDKDKQYFKEEITLTDRQNPEENRKVESPENNTIPLSQARSNLRGDLSQIISLPSEQVDALAKILAPFIKPSIVYDSVATENARNTMAAKTEEMKISLKRGQTIVREGDTINDTALSQISAIRSYSTSTRQLNRFFGLLALISALFWAGWKYIKHRGAAVSRITLSEEKTFALFGFVVVVQTILMAICFRLADFTAAENVKAPLNDPTLWAFAIPFAFGSLLMTLLTDRKTALFTGLFISFLAGLLAPRGLEFVLYAAISSAVAVYGIGRYRTRQSVTTAGALVGVSSAFTAIALIAYTQQPFILNTILLAVGCGLLGGIITAAATAVFMPLCESIFGIMTDVKLLELSNADLPALGQLALRAPGTNQHSHAVGQLAEDACRKVGANGLLARIGALYHDIGKTAAPEHFVENQMGKNPHDRLKPTQSARIIISHVTHGAKLAKDMGLPARIVDFIPQHHGTRTLHYFLKKAQAEAKEGEEVVENDFRYPGPKPQFKESAIMMIADSCEAAARSLSEPTPENIRFIVTKIIDAILSDDQLDECDLTLRELTQIRESMIKSLIAIYHTRVEYPGYAPPDSKSKITIEADSEERGMRYHNPADIPISKGGEVEDEAIDRSQQPNVEEASEHAKHSEVNKKAESKTAE